MQPRHPWRACRPPTKEPPERRRRPSRRPPSRPPPSRQADDCGRAVIDERFYDLKGPATAAELAAMAGLKVVRGDPQRRVASLGSVKTAGPDDLTFLEDDRAAEAVSAGVCFASTDASERIPAGVVVIEAANPRAAYVQAVPRLAVSRELEP